MDILQTIQTPIYTTTLPSNGKEIEYRPFLRKEEKILLIALQSQDPKEMARAIKQIIKNCIVSQINFDELTTYDIEYLTLKVRLCSNNETVTITFNPIENSTCPECSKQRSIDVDLNQIKIFKNPEHSSKFWLIENVIGVIMREPNGKMFEKIQDIFWGGPTTIDKDQDLILSHIDYIFTPTEQFSFKDIPKEKQTEWIESLLHEQYKKLENFFSTLPKLKCDIDVNCKTCGFKEIYKMESLSDFFV